MSGQGLFWATPKDIPIKNPNNPPVIISNFMVFWPFPTG
jgi:hypothetical protein